jgi:hypothetical protein
VLYIFRRANEAQVFSGLFRSVRHDTQTKDVLSRFSLCQESHSYTEFSLDSDGLPKAASASFTSTGIVAKLTPTYSNSAVEKPPFVKMAGANFHSGVFEYIVYGKTASSKRVRVAEQWLANCALVDHFIAYCNRRSFMS